MIQILLRHHYKHWERNLQQGGNKISVTDSLIERIVLKIKPTSEEFPPLNITTYWGKKIKTHIDKNEYADGRKFYVATTYHKTQQKESSTACQLSISEPDQVSTETHFQNYLLHICPGTKIVIRALNTLELIHSVTGNHYDSQVETLLEHRKGGDSLFKRVHIAQFFRVNVPNLHTTCLTD